MCHLFLSPVFSASVLCHVPQLCSLVDLMNLNTEHFVFLRRLPVTLSVIVSHILTCKLFIAFWNVLDFSFPFDRKQIWFDLHVCSNSSNVEIWTEILPKLNMLEIDEHAG